MTRKKRTKKKGKLAGVGLALIASGAALVEKGRVEAGVILIIIGAAFVAATKYA